ncbi:MAG: MATE family efflux transporter, partial [Clostridiales bacterium]|nr:MATE family efflux transporter [Clostridiales bacterium]
MRIGMIIGIIIGLPVAIITFLHGDIPASIFTDNPEYIKRAAEFLRGFAPEAIITSILFSFLGYFNGHSKSTFVMIQGLIQSFMIRLPFSYIMSIRPNASLTYIGQAAPLATLIGIVMCIIYFSIINSKQKRKLSK